MVLHGISNDIFHFIESSIVDAIHGMHDATLHWLQTVGNMGYGAL
jgi:hypothetical protein